MLETRDEHMHDMRQLHERLHLCAQRFVNVHTSLLGLEISMKALCERQASYARTMPAHEQSVARRQLHGDSKRVCQMKSETFQPSA